MIDAGQFLIFSIDGQRFGVRLSCVSRVIHAVEITPLPDAPPIVVGVINAAGSLVPVVSIRRRFQLPEREWGPDDRLIMVRTSRPGGQAGEGRMLALAVDAVAGVSDFSGQEMTAADSILAGLTHLEGLAKTGPGIVLICDLAKFLSLDEEKVLEAVMPGGAR